MNRLRYIDRYLLTIEERTVGRADIGDGPIGTGLVDTGMLAGYIAEDTEDRRIMAATPDDDSCGESQTDPLHRTNEVTGLRSERSRGTRADGLVCATNRSCLRRLRLWSLRLCCLRCRLRSGLLRVLGLLRGSLRLLRSSLRLLRSCLWLRCLRLRVRRAFELAGLNQFRTALRTTTTTAEDLAGRTDIELCTTLVAEIAITLNVTFTFGAFN